MTVAVARGLLVAGTTSDAGKSLVTSGICRWLARTGVSVAPFKAQNMSNNSMVCPDGAEIGRAQWLQAQACGVTPEAAMNPVLLKPGSDRRSHVVVMGRPHGELSAGEWATGRKALSESAFAAFDDLVGRFDVVVAEGAGSPAEINLRQGDYVNLGLARAKDLPVVVVGDIDRGGVLAAMYGTLGLLEPADAAHVRGWIINKFRGDLDLLRPGLAMLEERTARPVLGVLPFLRDVWLDSEDALALGGWQGSVSPAGAGTGSGSASVSLTVAVVRFPRISNATDVDALAAEPGVRVVVTADPDVAAAADLLVLPGSRATLSDLAWLRSRGLDEAITARSRSGRPTLGICGGYQMLALELVDEDGVESSRPERVAGLGLLPATVAFRAEKHLGTPRGAWRGHDVTAYEIHHGVAQPASTPGAEPFLDGWALGPVWGTMWHGAFENDGFRREFLREVASRVGSRWRPDATAPGHRQRREEMLDRLGDAVEEHFDTAALMSLIDGSRPAPAPQPPASGRDAGPGPGGGRRVVVVGIGADGWSGLATASRAAIEQAGAVIGSPRQLRLLPAHVSAEQVRWPSPLRPAVAALVATYRASGLVVLASGDPMWHGIGTTLAAEVGASALTVLPHPSSVSLACAALAWPVEDTTVVSLVDAPPELVLAACHQGQRVLVLSRDGATPGAVAGLLSAHGYGGSQMTVLSGLGAATTGRRDGVARTWDAGPMDPLNVVAVRCRRDEGALAVGLTPGLADGVYEHDGQLTKREVRSITLASLAPEPGELLWDVGGGSGSVAIEWMRAHPRCRAVSFERRRDRANRIIANAARLGVPGLQVCVGDAPGVLVGQPRPDAVFIGGGLMLDGVVEACWTALRPGGRLVANAVTIESQSALATWRARLGGELTRIEVARAGAVGGFTAWRPAMPVVQWRAVTPAGHDERNAR